jgi:hypothetical protein
MKRTLLLALALLLTLPLAAVPLYYQGFDYDAGVELPWPEWHTNTWPAAVTSDEGLSWYNYPVQGRAATFRAQTDESWSTNLFAIDLDPGGIGTATFYMSYIILPLNMDSNGGWGTQPVCVHIYPSSLNYREGFGMGIIQNLVNPSPDRWYEYYYMVCNQRPSRGYPVENMYAYKAFGPVLNETNFLIGKWEIEYGTPVERVFMHMNVYTDDAQIPSAEPTTWDLAVIGTNGVPTAGKTLDSLTVHRDNIVDNVIFDEIRIADNYYDVTPIPEPALLSAAGLAVLALLRRR